MPLATFVGSDTSCITDLERIDRQVTSPREVIGQRVLRRWQTQRGALASINGNPDFGWNVTQLVNKKLAPGDIASAQAQLKAEAEKDEQVESCSVSIASGAGVVSISASFKTTEGPFSLTMDVRDLTVAAVFRFGDQ